MNVYFVRDGSGVLLFDAGIEAMTNAVAAAGAALGGITRVVLGHAHADHRGVAPGLGVAGLLPPRRARRRRGRRRRALLRPRPSSRWYARPLFPRAAASSGTAGPVQIAGTVAEGDEVAGFKVVHLPGHAPGLIALWRASDRLALASDCFYTLDPQTGRQGPPARARTPRSTSTPSRRARRSASSPTSSRRRRGPATPTRSPATCAPSCSEPRPRRPDGQALAPARARPRSSSAPETEYVSDERRPCSSCAAR